MAVATGFVVVAILEPVLRAWKPWTEAWLVTANAPRLYLGTSASLLDGGVLTPGRATVTALGYLVALTALAVALFRRRDVAATG